MEDVTLNEDLTQALLQEVNRAYRTEINDLLLAALALALNQWQGKKDLSLTLEGHGREPLFPELDLSRTVGWFTSTFPVHLSLPAKTNDLGAVIKSIKEQLHAIPDKGLSFGLLRYFHQDKDLQQQLSQQDHLPIVFNYLGQFDASLKSTWFTLAKEPHGEEVSPENTDQSLLTMNGSIEGGQLHFDLNYLKSAFHSGSIKKFANAFKQNLETLIQHCRAQTESHATPSDFPLANLTQEELDALHTHDLDNLYPQTPVQQGMVFHSLYNPDDYITQMDWSLEGELNHDAFQQAWNALLMQFDILRTSFHQSLNGKPIQCLHHTLNIPWTFHDWQKLTPEEQQQAFAQLKTQDQHQAFDLEQAPLMRLCLIQETSNRYRLFWTSHHLLLDGWSMPLLYRQLMLNYEALVQGKSAPANKTRPYSDYVAWLLRQDQEKARLFWQDTLADKHPTRLPFAKANARTLGQQASLHWQAPVALSEQVIELGQREGLTSNTIVQGLWALLLSHYSNSKNVLIGVTVSGEMRTFRASMNKSDFLSIHCRSH